LALQTCSQPALRRLGSHCHRRRILNSHKASTTIRQSAVARHPPGPTLDRCGNGASRNTVYLRRHDCDSAFDDRRVAVVAVFDLIDGHLALDDSRVGAGSSGWQEFTQDLGGDAPVGVGECLRGKNPGGLRSFAERPGGIW
jgi:hypothetical protein